MTSTLLLFDIDGTLIRTRAGRWAFNQAFERQYGLSDAASEIPMAGRTDPQIFMELCERHGLDPNTFQAWKLEFLALLAERLTEEPGDVLPGVRELVSACSQDPAFTLALGTGNVEEGARLKLAAHDLNRFFPTGGFGGDGTTRAEVIAAGINRAKALRSVPFDRLVVIGDTPLDIECGKANGCLTVGVATSYYSGPELAAAGADVVLENFLDLQSVLSAFHTIGWTPEK